MEIIFPDPKKVEALYDQLIAIIKKSDINEAEAISLVSWLATGVIVELWSKRGLNPQELLNHLSDGIKGNLENKAKKNCNNTVH